MSKTDHYRHASGEYQYPSANQGLPRKMFLDAVANNCPRVMQGLWNVCAVIERGAAVPEIDKAVQDWAKTHHLHDSNRRVPRWIRGTARRAAQLRAQYGDQITTFNFATAESSVSSDQEIEPGIAWDVSESTRTEFESGYKASGRRLTKTVRDRLDAVKQIACERGAVRPPRGWSPEHYTWAVRVLCNGDTPRSLACEIVQIDNLTIGKAALKEQIKESRRVRTWTIEKAVKGVLSTVGLHCFVVRRGRPPSHS